MAGLESVEAFAQTLLGEALKDQFNVTVDLGKTLLCLRRPSNSECWRWKCPPSKC
jgi:hypothetical protein